MNLTLIAECIVYLPSHPTVVVTMVNVEAPIKESLKALRPWQNVDTLNLYDQKADGTSTNAEVKNLWFIDAMQCDSLADVMIVRFVPRPDVKPMTTEIQQ